MLLPECPEAGEMASGNTRGAFYLEGSDDVAVFLDQEVYLRSVICPPEIRRCFASWVSYFGDCLQQYPLLEEPSLNGGVKAAL